MKVKINYPRFFLKLGIWTTLMILILFRYPKPVDISIEPRYDRLLEEKKDIQKTHSRNVFTGDIVKYIGEEIPKEEIIIVNKIPEEPQVTQKEKNFFLYQIMEESFGKNIEMTHASARNYSKDVKKLCAYYPFTCNVVNLDSRFTTKDNLYYLAISSYLFEYIWKPLPKLYDNLYYVKIQENENGRRGYAGHYSVIINLQENIDYKEFFEVLNHELGHIVDLWLIEWNSDRKDNVYTEFGKANFNDDDPSIDFYKISWESEKMRKKTHSSKDFVSWYALTDPFEDFAETYNMYVNHNEVFKMMAKESIYLEMKYKFIEKYLEWKYIKKWKYENYKYEYRTWDTTRIQ